MTQFLRLAPSGNANERTYTSSTRGARIYDTETKDLEYWPLIPDPVGDPRINSSDICTISLLICPPWSEEEKLFDTCKLITAASRQFTWTTMRQVRRRELNDQDLSIRKNILNTDLLLNTTMIRFWGMNWDFFLCDLMWFGFFHFYKKLFSCCAGFWSGMCGYDRRFDQSLNSHPMDCTARSGTLRQYTRRPQQPGNLLQLVERAATTYAIVVGSEIRVDERDEIGLLSSHWWITTADRAYELDWHRNR